PKGMFQAWAMCEKYHKPCKTSRVIDNNSELLALDHFLVSDCLKNNIVGACLSDLCIEKCGKTAEHWIRHHKHNALVSTPYSGGIFSEGNCLSCVGTLFTLPNTANNYVFQYGGSVVKSFFTHRVYC